MLIQSYFFYQKPLERVIENVVFTLTEGFFHIHVGRVWFSHETCAAVLSSCFIVEVAFFVLPPEIDTRAKRIVDALVYAIKIEFTLEL